MYTETARVHGGQRHICVTGLTCAGKTTHAQLIAQLYDMNYLSAAGIMYGLLGYTDRGMNDAWVHDADQLEISRDRAPIDEAVNAELARLAEYNRPTVFDSWALPYLALGSPVVRYTTYFLRLESSMPARITRCLASQGPNPQIAVPDVVRVLESKDSKTHQRFHRMFRLSPPVGTLDVGYRDASLNLSRFVYGPSLASVLVGVGRAQEAVELKLSTAPLTHLPREPQ